MFMVEDDAAEAIRRAYLEKGEWPAVAELRRFYRIDDNAAAFPCRADHRLLASAGRTRAGAGSSPQRSGLPSRGGWSIQRPRPFLRQSP